MLSGNSPKSDRPIIMHPSQELWVRHHPPNGYPPDVIPVPDVIPGLAFFPGGYGLWGIACGQPLPPFPIGGIMIVGQDFHSEKGYQASYQRGGEPQTLPTWRNLLKLLTEVEIAPERCFFTNLYMGLRAGSTATGIFPGASDLTFVAHCKQFLLEQIQVQRPALILTLGIQVPPVVGTLFPELEPWSGSRGLRHLDKVGPVQTNVTFPGVDDFATIVVALTHPSLRHASVRYRRYKDAKNHEAEMLMLKDALGFMRFTER